MEGHWFYQKDVFPVASNNWHPSEQKLEVEENAYSPNWVYSHYLNFFCWIQGRVWNDLKTTFFFLTVFENKMKSSFRLESAGITACCPDSDAQPLGLEQDRMKLGPCLWGWEAVITGYETWTLKADCFYVSCPFFAVSLLFSLLEFAKDLLENSDLSYPGGNC